MIRLLFTWLAFALCVSAISRTRPPPGAKVVAQTGSPYTSLQEAIDSIDKNSTATTKIFIKPGTYTGQTFITSGYQGKIIVYGYTTDDHNYAKNEVILTNSLSSSQAGGNEKSGTLRVHSPNVSFYNLRIENTAGDAGPSHALSILATKTAYYGCALTGYQDTMFGHDTDSVFKNSYIEGAVDFIYGGTNVNFWFEECDIANNRAAGGYITASGRESNDQGWYVINNSRVIAKPGISVNPGSVWLGRPWRYYARAVFQNSQLPDIIQLQGWHPWDKGDDLSNVYYGEFNNGGAGSNTNNRVSWAKQLEDAVSIDNTIPDWKGWVDQKYWNDVVWS